MLRKHIPFTFPAHMQQLTVCTVWIKLWSCYYAFFAEFVRMLSNCWEDHPWLPCRYIKRIHAKKMHTNTNMHINRSKLIQSCFHVLCKTLNAILTFLGAGGLLHFYYIMCCILLIYPIQLQNMYFKCFLKDICTWIKCNIIKQLH